MAAFTREYRPSHLEISAAKHRLEEEFVDAGKPERCSDPEPQPHESSWADLLLYCAAGFGLLAAAGLGFSLVSPVGTMADTFLRLLLNAIILTATFYMLGVRRGKVALKTIGLRPPVWRWSWLLIAIGLSAILIPIRGLVGMLAQLLVGGGIEGMQTRLDVLTPGIVPSAPGLGLSILIMGGVVPIAEELYFRGLIHTGLRSRLGLWPSTLLSALVFGLAHFDAIGLAVSSFLLGLVNALALEKTKSIWLPIALHMFTNITGVALLAVMSALLQVLGQ